MVWQKSGSIHSNNERYFEMRVTHGHCLSLEEIHRLKCNAGSIIWSSATMQVLPVRDVLHVPQLPINENFQKTRIGSPRDQVLYLSYSSIFSSQKRQRYVPYNETACLPAQIAIAVHNNDKQRSSCNYHGGNAGKTQTFYRVSSSQSIEFISTNILGPLPKWEQQMNKDEAWKIGTLSRV